MPRLLYLALLILLFIQSIFSYYYYEDFSTAVGAGNPEWETNLLYGRTGVSFVGIGQDSDQRFVNGKLEIRGYPKGSSNSLDANRNGFWGGRWAICSNKYTASEYEPFGIEIIRTRCDMDYSVGRTYINWSDTQDFPRRQILVGIMLCVTNGIDWDQEFSMLNYFIDFSDHCGSWGNPNEVSFPGVGNRIMEYHINWFDGVEHNLELAQTSRPDEVVTNISNFVYFDYGLSNANATVNNDHIGWRIIHYGTSIELLINPNPRGTNGAGMPDEWILVAKKEPVGWSNDIQYMIGHAGKHWQRGTEGFQEANADFDELLVKSSADYSELLLEPALIALSPSEQTVTLVLSNEIAASLENAGVNYIRIIKPYEFDWNTDFTNTIVISNYYNGSAQELVNTYYSSGTFPADGQAAIMTNYGENEIRILLGNQITNMADASMEIIRIQLQMTVSNEGFPNLPLKAYVMAEQFDSMTDPKKKWQYSTCGWQRCRGDGKFGVITLPADGYASITPDEIAQGSISTPYAFTYYIRGTAESYHEDISNIAITIPSEFSNCTFNLSSVDSILLGTNEASCVYFTNISGVTNRDGSTNLLYISYTENSTFIGRSGLDVITFQVQATSSSSPPLFGNLEWACFADSAPISASSTKLTTNINYPNQLVSVVPSTIESWDLQVRGAGNFSPISMGVSNIIAMSYIDIIKDGHSADEAFTGCDVIFGGKSADVKGQVLLYRDSDLDKTAFTIASEVPVASNYFSDASQAVTLTFSDTNLSIDNQNATRYWVTLRITNNDPDVFTNTVFMQVTNITGVGTNSGTIEDVFKLTNDFSSKTARVDTHIIYASSTTILADDVKQGSFNNTYFKFILSNSDPDATNFLYQFIASNKGTAIPSDCGFLKIFRDTGSAAFDPSEDTLIMAGGMNANKRFVMSVYPPVELSDTSNVVLWGVFDVEFTGVSGRTIDLEIPNSTNISFFDKYGDHSDPRPVVMGSFPSPGTTYESFIIPYSSRVFDFYLDNVTYTMVDSFTTNQDVPAGYFKIFADTEDTNTQIFEGIDVTIDSSGSAAETKGIAYIYRETNNASSFSAANCSLVSSTNVTGADFSISCAVTDISVNQAEPTKLYLIFRLTNDIEAAKSDTAYFSITNFRASGPDGGIVSNMEAWTSLTSDEARIDKYEVVIVYISNAMTTNAPEQGWIDNPYLKIAMRGDDDDVIQYLSGINVATNSKTTANIAGGHIPFVKAYVGGQMVGISEFYNGVTNIDIPSSRMISGTNIITVIIRYDIFGSATVGAAFGLEIPPNAFSFSDLIYDDFDQASFAISNTTGPAIETNITIRLKGALGYDVMVNNIVVKNPSRSVAGYEVPLFTFNVFKDKEGGEAVTGLKLSNRLNTKTFSGIVRVYSNSADSLTMADAVPVTASNHFISDTSSLVNITFSNNVVVSDDPGTASRFWITYEPETFASEAQNQFEIIELLAIGNDSGAVDFKSGFTFPEHISSLMKLDDLHVNIGFTSVISNQVRQNDSDVEAIKLDISAEDLDSSFSLSKLVFTIAPDVSSNDITGGALYHDNGTEDGVFDKGDILIEGSGGTFVKNKMISPLLTPLTFDHSGTTVFYVVNIHKDAAVDNVFTLSLKKADQDGFDDITILNTDHSLILNDYSPDTTEPSTILPEAVKAGAEPLLTSSLIDCSKGRKSKIYLPESYDLSKYTAFVYDALGNRIKIIKPESYMIEFGCLHKGKTLPAGIYFIMIEGPGIKESYKIMVTK
ncbi:hypothetical protein ACFL6D_02390 [Spirochaetota bacterium]